VSARAAALALAILSAEPLTAGAQPEGDPPMPRPESLREAALRVWESYLNVPYLWGGDDPLAGVDCSGLALEGLKAVGVVPRELQDANAHALLHDVFKDRLRVDVPEGLRPGMLVFWARPDGSIRHVEIVWAVYPAPAPEGVRVLTIGASGGGSKTVDRAEAIKANAYVKIRRITPGWLVAVDPFPL
jgi:NlpC/P60 family protein